MLVSFRSILIKCMNSEMVMLVKSRGFISNSVNIENKIKTNVSRRLNYIVSLMVDEVGNDITLKRQSGMNPLLQSGGVCGTLSRGYTGLCLG